MGGRMKTVAVLMGGTSSEREVSLVSGTHVAQALESLGRYRVLPLDIKEESLAALPSDVDVVYLALHGGWGENGGVQKLLNERRLPYTGPGEKASRLAMDKILTKEALDAAGVPTAPWARVTRTCAASPRPLPVVVKAPCDGSSFGVVKVSTPDTWAAALDTAFREAGPSCSEVLVEDFIPGREFTVALLDGEAWPVLEIVAPGGWYGYEEKYISSETRYEFLEDPALAARLQTLARQAYDALGCRSVTRVDFRVSEAGEPFVLELNTSPGFTPHSLVPKAGMKTGLSFAGVCERILSTARFDEP